MLPALAAPELVCRRQILLLPALGLEESCRPYRLVLGLAGVRGELLGARAHELDGRQVPVQGPPPRVRVGGVLEVEEQRPEFGLVPRPRQLARLPVAVVLEDGRLDGGRDGGRAGRGVAELVARDEVEGRGEQGAGLVSGRVPRRRRRRWK